MYFADGTQLCAQSDPELFFPESNMDYMHTIGLIKQICNACPLFAKCKTYSENTPGLYGVWAGQLHTGAGYISPASYKIERGVVRAG